MPIMPPQDDRDDLDCQESLEVEFLAHAGPALKRLWTMLFRSVGLPTRRVERLCD